MMSDDSAVRSSGFTTTGTVRRPFKGSPLPKRLSRPLLTRRSLAPNLSSSSPPHSTVVRSESPPPPSRKRLRTMPMSEETQGGAESPGPRLKKAPKFERRYIRDVMAGTKCHVLANTLDSDGLIDNKPTCTFLSPDTLMEGLKDKTNEYHAWVAVKQAMETPASTQSCVELAMELTLVELGAFQLERYPGCHFTFVDPRLAEDEVAIVNKVQSLSRKFEAKHISRSSIVFNIPATLSGINAAKTISLLGPAENRIKTNLILVQGLTHAAACTEASPFAVTLSVGPVMRWHEGASTVRFRSLSPLEHPAMSKIHTIRVYFTKNRIPVKLLAGEFRKLEEIEQLLLFPGLVLSLRRMNELRWARTYTTDADIDPLSSNSKPCVIAATATYPSEILAGLETQPETEGPPDFLPPMSLHTHTMAEHNIRGTLSAMAESIKDFEAYIREEVMKWEERAKPLRWDTALSVPVTAHNSPEKGRKPWDVNRNGSLEPAGGKLKREKTVHHFGSS